MPHQPIYHVYNQGNDRRTIFIEERNYSFFLGKVRKRFTGVSEILAYCLMPNHFHFLMTPTAYGLSPSSSKAPKVNAVEGDEFVQLTRFSVAVQGLLSGYARAFNSFYGRSGSVFRQKTKVDVTGYLDDDLTIIDSDGHTKACFQYIHLNPVKADLCAHPSEWGYSSFLEYEGWITEEEGLCNREIGAQLWTG